MCIRDRIGGATAEEVEAAKKEALLKDRSVKKGEDLVENKKKAGCDGDCKTCTRRHCPYGKK